MKIKTIQECKDEVAKQYCYPNHTPFENWESLEKFCREWKNWATPLAVIDKAMQLYADSQKQLDTEKKISFLERELDVAKAEAKSFFQLSELLKKQPAIDWGSIEAEIKSIIERHPERGSRKLSWQAAFHGLRELYPSGLPIQRTGELQDILNCIMKAEDFDSIEQKAAYYDIIQRDLRKYFEKPIQPNDKEALERLNEVWGDDKDGKYAELYNHHKTLQPNEGFSEEEVIKAIDSAFAAGVDLYDNDGDSFDLIHTRSKIIQSLKQSKKP
jgi:hypothetical protein